MVVHASDCSATQCNPIAQQSAKIVTARAMQRTTLTRLETHYPYVNPSGRKCLPMMLRDLNSGEIVSLILCWQLCIALPRQFSFDFQLQRQTKERAN